MSLQNDSREPPDERKVRYAVVGAGWISQEDFMPGVEHTGNSVMTALVTGDRTKAKALAKRYAISRLYDYDDYEKMLESGEVDAVYLAVPNSMHRDYAVAALNAGIHVLCEKPMARTEEECREMIEAADREGAKLMIAYRLHFDEASVEAIEMVRSGMIGDPRFFSSVFAQQLSEENSRAKARFWANPLPDMGPYPINAARHLFQAEPLEVFAFSARKEERRFDEIDEMLTVSMRFPEERLATFTVSYGANSIDAYRIVGTLGDLEVNPGFGFTEPLRHRLTIGTEVREKRFPKTDQFGAETKYFSQCILEDRDPEPDGEEGLADIRVLRAVEEALEAEMPKPVMARSKRQSRPCREQIIRLPAVKSEELIEAAAPGGS
ncbi:MAG TPA: Gfo/Idh/MocA family oxidoreductase [Chthoniobacterales bacterium]|nr:Gfo/Idh/MocA family oxidoreductase [Chthoniobacterales bacterium]